MTNITGPAVTFHPGALSVWLKEAPGAGELAGADFSRAENNLFTDLDILMQALREDDEQSVWVLAEGVEDIDFFRKTDGDGPNGAVIHVDLNNRIRLASLHQDPKEFTGEEQHGAEAAAAALDNVARQADQLVARYLHETGADAEVTGHEVTVHIGEHTRGLKPEHVLGLEAALGTAALDRLIDHETGKLRLDRNYDLAAAVRYARRHGLRYVEYRELIFDSEQAE